MAGVSLKGKRVLVTGAARRIGREIALAMADEGADIVIHYRDSDAEACEVCAEIRERGASTWQVRADFRVREDYETLIERVLVTAGGLDIVVNNAASAPSEQIEEMTFDSLMDSLQVNAYAPFTLTKAFAFQAGKGQVINILDSRVTECDWEHVGYILSKQALASLTKMCAVRFAPDVTVNAVAPGLIIAPPGGWSSTRGAVDALPLKRRGDPRDVAEAVIFLAKSDFITGETIFVDGGRHMV